MMKNFGVTLIEMLVVITVIGILATLSFTQYVSYRERALDSEAKSNLRLILAAERIRFNESDLSPAQYTIPTPTNDAAGINNILKLLIPTNNPSWNYTITTYAVNTDFCAQASRNNPPAGYARSWRIRAPSTDTGRSLDPQPEDQACP